MKFKHWYHRSSTTLLEGKIHVTFLDSQTATYEVQVLVQHKFIISAKEASLFFLIHADQFPSMAKAIPQSFPNTVHKLCRWHILKKYKEYLALLYKKYKTFKEEFTAILNWPLMPTEFETAWAELVHKYNLEIDQMMI